MFSLESLLHSRYQSDHRPLSSFNSWLILPTCPSDSFQCPITCPIPWLNQWLIDSCQQKLQNSVLDIPQQLLSTDISIYFTTALHEGRNSSDIWTMHSFMTPNPFHIAPLQDICPSPSLISLWSAHSLVSHVSPSTVAITTEAEREILRRGQREERNGSEKRDKSHLWVWGDVFIPPRRGVGCHLFPLIVTFRRARIVAFQFHFPILKCDLLFKLP